jgi:proteic killer suppression protein
MIGSFRSKALQELYQAGASRRIGADHVRKCIRILSLLEASEQPEDMTVAGLHFHSLQGKPQRWSVRVSANYRITFGWSGKNAVDIDYEDYH